MTGATDWFRSLQALEEDQKALNMLKMLDLSKIVIILKIFKIVKIFEIEDIQEVKNRDDLEDRQDIEEQNDLEVLILKILKAFKSSMALQLSSCIAS